MFTHKGKALGKLNILHFFSQKFREFHQEEGGEGSFQTLNLFLLLNMSFQVFVLASLYWIYMLACFSCNFDAKDEFLGYQNLGFDLRFT